MRPLVIALALLLALAAPTAAQDDPVQVDPEAGDVISESEAEELRSRIEEEGVPVTIAILPASAGDAEQIATDLRERTGTAAAVVVGNRFRVDGPPEIEQAATEAFQAHSDEGVAPVLLDFVDRAAGGGGEDGGGIGAGGVILLGALGDDIRALEIDMDMPGVSGEARADYETAVAAYQRADQSWRLAQRPDDLEPVGAALEEGRWAMSSARTRLEGRAPPERRSPCFFDPRHGPSDREVEWAPDGGAPRMVPACEADAQRVERGEDPEAREVTVGGRRMPYWAAGPAYAPFIGGFFGAGILPGLMMGTMLGSAWDAPTGDFGGGDFGGGDFGGGDFGGGDF
jgi:hypothetical protein